MQPISLQVDGTEANREAIAEDRGREVSRDPSILDIPAHPSGAILKSWSREELFTEMIDP